MDIVLPACYTFQNWFQFSLASFQVKHLGATSTESEDFNEKEECSRRDTNHGLLE